jgi:integrase
VVRVANALDRSPLAARRILRKGVDEITNGYLDAALEATTFDDLVKLVLDDYQANGRRSHRDAKHRIRKHLLRFFGGWQARDILASDVQAFVAKRQGEGATNGEINRELTLLKRAYNLGLRDEVVTRKPAIRMLKEPPPRQGFFEKEEYEHLLAKLPDYLRAPITFAYWTGWRTHSEILTLTWAQVDLAEGTVRLLPSQSKNGEGRIIALSLDLKALMERLWQEHLNSWRACPLVFHRRGQRIKAFRDAWDSACKRAGLVKEDGRPSKIPHDFRRTAARNMVRAGIPERVVMQLLGHKTRSMLDRYNIVNEADLREAARRLDDTYGSSAKQRRVQDPPLTH